MSPSAKGDIEQGSSHLLSACYQAGLNCACHLYKSSFLGWNVLNSATSVFLVIQNDDLWIRSWICIYINLRSKWFWVCVCFCVSRLPESVAYFLRNHFFPLPFTETAKQTQCLSRYNLMSSEPYKMFIFFAGSTALQLSMWRNYRDIFFPFLICLANSIPQHPQIADFPLSVLYMGYI